MEPSDVSSGFFFVLEAAVKVRRLPNNPIIRPDMDERMGSNINGPSLVRAPGWIKHPLGEYYLYFAHHDGNHIRLAYANHLGGPWHIYTPGTLSLVGSYCQRHIASPDAYVDDDRHEIRMYYHGGVPGGQVSKVALSGDGLSFQALPEPLGAPYFRVFRWQDWFYGLGMPGIFYRSRDGLRDFEKGPTLFTSDMRHTALKLDGNMLGVFYSNAGDCPERILFARIELTCHWMNWQASSPITVIAPEMDYEGAHLPLEPSLRGQARERARQLRDPAIFQEKDRTYLLYSVAGEQGIAIAELLEENTPPEIALHSR